MKVLRNQLVLPLNFEVLIDENDPVWKLTEICDALDYSRLYDEYLRHWRSIDPVIMFEILVFAYMNGIYSSRGIEQACKTDIRFMWLLQGEPAPDHSTFARFQNEKLVGVIEDLFYQLILKLHELGEIEFNNIFIDGTKIEANANRYT
ncbi:MAG: transposase, partial [Ruminococcus sp.]|nr:transposase [Ruminococcus sp.]